MRLTRRGKRRLLVVAALAVLACVGFFAMRFLRGFQTSKLVREARVAGLSAHDAGDLDAALSKLSYVIQQDKTDREVILAFADARSQVPLPNAGHITESLGYYKLGEELLEEELLKRPNDPVLLAEQQRVRVALLDVYSQLRLPFETVQTADKLLAADPSHLPALIAKAQIAFAARDYEQAEHLTNRLIELEPEDLAWRELLLNIRRRQGVMPDQIVAITDEWIDAYKGADGRFYLLKASLLEQLGRIPEAQEAATTAARLGANSRPMLQYLITMLDALQLTGIATDVIDRAFAEFPEEQWVRQAAVHRLWQANRLEEALEAVALAEEQFEELEPGLRKLKALVLNALGEREQAVAVLRTLLLADDEIASGASEPNAGERAEYTEAEQNHLWAEALIATFQSDSKDRRKTISLLERAVLRMPRDPVLHAMLGDMYGSMGDMTLALEEQARAYELDTGWLGAGSAYVSSLLKMGRFEDAYRVALEIARRSPQNRLTPVLLYAQAYVSLLRSGQAERVISEHGGPEHFVAVMEAYYEQAPHHPQLTTLLAESYALHGRPDEAQRLIDGVLADEQTQPTTLLALAEVSERYQLERTEVLLDATSGTDAVRLPHLVMKANLLAAEGKTKEGLALIEQALREAGESLSPGEIVLVRLRYLIDTNDSRVEAELKQAVRKHADSLAVQSFAIGVPATWKERQFAREVIDNFAALVGKQSQQAQLAEVNYLIQFEADNEERLAKAIVELGDILRQSPDSLAALTLMADASLAGRRPNHARAVEHLQRAVDLHPGRAGLYPRLIRLLQSQGDYERAGRYLARFGELAEANPNFRRDEIALQQQQGNYAAALSSAASVIDEHSNITDQLALATMYAKAGRADDAEVIYDRLLAQGEQREIVASHVADFYARTGRVSDGASLLNRLSPRGGEAEKARLLGAFYSRHGEPRKADEWLRRAVQLDGKSADARYQLARYLMSMGRRDEARKQAMAGLRLEPDHYGLRSIMAVASLSGGREARAEAIKMLRELHRDNDSLVATLELLQRIPEVDGVPQPKQEHFAAARQLIEQHSEFQPAWMLTITLHREAGRMDDAIMLARRAVSRFPTDPQPAQWATSMLINAGRFGDALVEGQEWQRRSLDDPLPATLAVAEIYLKRGEPQLAYQQLQPYGDQIVSSANHDMIALGMWLDALISNGRIEEASAIVRPMLERDVRYRFTWAQLSDDRPLGVADAILSMIDPTSEASSEELMLLAGQWASLGKRGGDAAHLDRAERYAKEAAQRDAATAPASWLMLGAVAEAREKFDEAEQHYRRLLERYPDDPGALNNLAYTLLRQSETGGVNRLTEALSLVSRALEQAPKQPDVRDTRGLVRMALGSLEGAVEDFKSALEVRPDDVPIMLNLAEAQTRSGSHESAEATLSRVQAQLDRRRRSGLGALPEDQQWRDRVEQLRQRLTAAADNEAP